MSALQTWCSHWNVALLVEGVDRNSPFAALRGYDEQVALLAEGVDKKGDFPAE